MALWGGRRINFGIFSTIRNLKESIESCSISSIIRSSRYWRLPTPIVDFSNQIVIQCKGMWIMSGSSVFIRRTSFVLVVFLASAVGSDSLCRRRWFRLAKRQRGELEFARQIPMGRNLLGLFDRIRVRIEVHAHAERLQLRSLHLGSANDVGSALGSLSPSIRHVGFRPNT